MQDVSLANINYEGSKTSADIGKYNPMSPIPQTPEEFVWSKVLGGEPGEALAVIKLEFENPDFNKEVTFQRDGSGGFYPVWEGMDKESAAAFDVNFQDFVNNQDIGISYTEAADTAHGQPPHLTNFVPYTGE